jgi:hypothetical protein
MAKHEVELANREAKVTSDEMSMKDFQTLLEQRQKSVEEHDRRVKEQEDEHQERVKKLKKSIETHNKDVEAHQKDLEEHERLIQQVKALREDKAKLELHVKDLEKGCINQEEQITNPNDAQAKQTTYTISAHALTTEPLELSLKASKTFEDTFGLIPDGRENAGMFMERQEEDLMIEGKTFKKRRFLQHPSLAVTGTPDSELNKSCGRFGSIKYSMPDGSSKLVEKFSPESLVRYNGRFMIQWVYMKEHQELDYAI